MGEVGWHGRRLGSKGQAWEKVSWRGSSVEKMAESGVAGVGRMVGSGVGRECLAVWVMAGVKR